MNIVLWVLAILFAASVVPSQAEAKTYYVSKSGSDKNNGVSHKKPFLTIKKAAQVAKNKDVVIVHSGVYVDAVEITGKTRGTDTLAFRVAPAESVSISGPVTLSNSTFVTFDGFRFTDANDYPVTVQNSYNCAFVNCTFSGARQSLLLQDGRLTFDRCELRDFASDGIVVDGSAELFVSNSRISGCTGSAIKVLKNARVALDASSIVDNVGDGIRVSVDANSSSGSGGACECRGTSPQVKRRQAYDLLATISPTASAHRKAILDARSAIGSSLNSHLWENEWSATDSGGQTVYSKSKEAVELLHAVYTNDVDSFISSPVTPAEAGVILQAINLLLEADQNLAICAITQATCAGGHHKSLENADTHFDDGERAFSEELYDRATQAFRAAWEAAQDAAKKVNGIGFNLVKAAITRLLPSDWNPISEPTLTVTSSHLTGNNSGVAMFTAGSFSSRDSDMSQNKQWGLRLRGKVTLASCTIKSNGVTGVRLEDGRTSDVDVSNLIVKDNLAYGLFAKNCELDFDAASLARWSISGSQVTIGAEGSDLGFNTLTINKGTIAAVSITDCTMKASSAKFADSGYGLYCNRSTVTFDAANFNGLTLSGHDYQIYGDDASDLTFAAFTLTGDGKYTVYVADSKLTAKDSTITGSKTSLAGFQSTMVLDGGTVSGGSQYGIANYNGTVTVNNCTLSGNGIGLYSDGGCSATMSTFTGNSAAGASVLRSAAFGQCTFEKNPKGLQIGNAVTGAVTLAASQIKDNTASGVWCDGCTLTFDATMQADWSVRDNGANFGATGSTLTFSDFTIANGTTYGVVTEKGALNLIDSTLAANGTGAFICADSTLVASGTKFANNTSYGAHVAGKGSFHNCSIAGNGSGLHLDAAHVTDAMLTGTNISGNTMYGLYMNNGSLVLSSQSAEGWSIDGNGCNIAGYQADISLTGATLTAAANCGLYAQYGSVNLRQSTITSKSNGVWSGSSSGFTIDRSTIIGAGTGSWGVVNLDGALTMRNSVVSDASDGVYSHGPTKTSTIYNTTIANVSDYGLYAYDGDLTVKNTIIVGTSGTSGLYLGSNANLIHTHNLVFGFATPFENTSADATELIKEPRFVDVANGDFRLGKGSPAINAGADLTASHTIDLLGNPRPSHKVFEIGAYEYTSPDGAFRVVEWKEEQ